MHATPRRRPRPRWIWSALAVFTLLGLTAVVIRLQESACALATEQRSRTLAAEWPPRILAAERPPRTLAPERPRSTLAVQWPPRALASAERRSRVLVATGRHSGTAVFHRDWSEVICSLGPLPPGGRYVSLSPAEYSGAALCGSYLDVGGPRGQVRVQVVDRCRACRPGRIDLSERAFAEIGDTRKGIIPVRYRWVRDPMPPRRLAFRIKPGSSRNWLALLTIDHGNPIRRVELRPATRRDGAAPGRWLRLRRGVDNYWALSGAGMGPFQVRVTDRYGRRAVVRHIDLSPGTVQHTRVLMYESSSRAGGPAGTSSAAPPTSPAPPPAPSATPDPRRPRSCDTTR